jgi:hypothetical protein
VNDDDEKGNERGIGKRSDSRANSSDEAEEYSQERGVSRFRFVTPWPGNFW